MAAVPIVLAARKKAETDNGLGYEGDDMGGGHIPRELGRTIRAAAVIQRFLRRRTIRTRFGEPPSTLAPCDYCS